MLHVALLEPEIPPNTGNVARLCAATGTRLHLIGRLGFRLDDRTLRRAGLDYWPAVDWVHHPQWADFEAAWLESASFSSPRPPRLWLVETPAPRPYTQAEFADGDCLLFGNESHGLPSSLRHRFADSLIGIPMPSGQVRSLNLATAVAIVLYDALRRIHRW
jgi:tRNA (cytidine/uridine-2'-O-)-methyltransferase